MSHFSFDRYYDPPEESPLWCEGCDCDSEECRDAENHESLWVGAGGYHMSESMKRHYAEQLEHEWQPDEMMYPFADETEVEQDEQ